MAREILKVPRLTSTETALLKQDHDAVELAFDDTNDLLQWASAPGTVRTAVTTNQAQTITGKTVSGATISASTITDGSQALNL